MALTALNLLAGEHTLAIPGAPWWSTATSDDHTEGGGPSSDWPCEQFELQLQARAKADGKHCGRPFIDTKLEGRIRVALAAPGRPGLHKIAKQFGVGSGTVQRIAAAS
jgi:hypothetical protein